MRKNAGMSHLALQRTTAVFNAANEAAVQEFLDGRIKFVSIVELIEGCLNKHSVKKDASLEELLEADSWAREQVRGSVKRKAKSAKP
jgi:1-deoxy-D-xylulose-5-phosphate reductoisomerase